MSQQTIMNNPSSMMNQQQQTMLMQLKMQQNILQQQVWQLNIANATNNQANNGQAPNSKNNNQDAKSVASGNSSSKVTKMTAQSSAFTPTNMGGQPMQVDNIPQQRIIDSSNLNTSQENLDMNEVSENKPTEGHQNEESSATKEVVEAKSEEKTEVKEEKADVKEEPVSETPVEKPKEEVTVNTNQEEIISPEKAQQEETISLVTPKKEENVVEEAVADRFSSKKKEPISEEVVKEIQEEDIKQDDEEKRSIEASNEKSKTEDVEVLPELLPEDRPEIIRYTRTMIMDFIKKECNQKLPESMETLMRNMISNKKPLQGQRDQHGGRRSGKGYDNRGDGRGGQMTKGKEYGKERGSKKNWGKNKDNQNANITRATYTEAELKKIQEIEGNMGNFTDAFKNVDDKEKKMRDIKLNLFAITAENYEDIRDILIDYCQEEALVQDVVKLIIDRAWTQPQFTKIYANLCHDLGSHPYEWTKKNDADPKENSKAGSKEFKSIVISLIRKEFFSGFASFKKYIDDLQKDANLTQEDKFERYLKKKGKLMGNMSFIAQLHLLKYLPIKVMRYITYN